MLNRNLPKQSLKGSTLELFKTDIIQSILDEYQCSGKCILILDERSSHLLSKYFSMTDIISKGLFSVELLSKSRKPFRSYDAIYIISNRNESINMMVKDFDTSTEENEHFNSISNYRRL